MFPDPFLPRVAVTVGKGSGYARLSYQTLSFLPAHQYRKGKGLAMPEYSILSSVNFKLGKGLATPEYSILSSVNFKLRFKLVVSDPLPTVTATGGRKGSGNIIIQLFVQQHPQKRVLNYHIPASLLYTV